MITTKNTIISLALLVVVLSGIFIWKRSTNDIGSGPEVSFSPTSSPQAEPSATPSKSPVKTNLPLPIGDGRTSFIGESVPWSLLLTDASCELKGEIKFLNHNTYDNQDALFSYKGVDNPGRNVFWTVSPQDNLSVGPNILNKTTIPDGESLLGIVLPENPKYQKYELTAKIQYGRLVDASGKFVMAGGNVKVFEKQCLGKTTVVLP